ncbi:MAG TPA: transposase, partial [Bacteroidetes bacterium]|nr:transposase [Bacteroidota bacterium]
MKRRKFTSKFKTKVVLEALKERNSLSELAQKYELSPAQISSWKKSFLANSEAIFEQKKPQISESEAERDRLLKAIGELK